MSETPTHYQAGSPLETSLKDLESRLRDVIEHPSTSIWLRKAIAELWERDVIDALEDVDTLRELLQAKQKTNLLMLDRWAEGVKKH
jgi:hypothetical protein